jgi:lambda family phage portal protein
MKWADRIDNFVGIFSPAAAVRRRHARSALARLSRRQDDDTRLSAWSAADSQTVRQSSWLTSRLSIDSDLAIDLELMRANAREAVKNDPYAVCFVESFVGNTVGRPIRFQSRIKAVEGDPLFTEANVKKWNTELEDLWKRVEYRIGFNGESWHEIQQLAMRHWAVDGEPILVFSDVFDDGRALPLTIQVIDPARLQTPHGKYGDSKVILGVERDARGKIVAYHFRKGVVGDSVRDSQEFQRITADRVCHVFDKWHADQTRGFPLLAPILGRLKDLRDYHDAEIMAAQVAACFGVVIKGTNPLAMADSRQSLTLTDKDGNAVEELRPGAVTYLNANSEATILNPNRPGGSVGDFTESILRAGAAGSNTPYELLAKDHSRTNYSSGRMSLLDGNQHYDRRQFGFIRGCCTPLWSRFVRQAVAFGETSIDPRDFNRRPWMYDRGQSMPPGRPWVDPVKDVQATQMEIEAGLITYADALAERGYDLDEVLEQRWKEKQKLKEFDLLPTEPEQQSNQPSKAQMSALALRVAELEERLELSEAKR